MQQVHNIRSYQPFPAVIPVHSASSLRVTHPSAMVITVQAPFPHWLACVKHSVSVHPEPGSNSSFNNIFLYLFFTFYSLTRFIAKSWLAFYLSHYFFFFFFHCPLCRLFSYRRNILYQKKILLSTLFLKFFCFFYFFCFLILSILLLISNNFFFFCNSFSFLLLFLFISLILASLSEIKAWYSLIKSSSIRIFPIK